MERSSGPRPPTSPITTKGKEHVFDDDEIDDEGLDQEIKDLVGESDNDDDDALLETNYIQQSTGMIVIGHTLHSIGSSSMMDLRKLGYADSYVQKTRFLWLAAVVRSSR